MRSVAVAREGVGARTHCPHCSFPSIRPSRSIGTLGVWQAHRQGSRQGKCCTVVGCYRPTWHWQSEGVGAQVGASALGARPGNM